MPQHSTPARPATATDADRRRLRHQPRRVTIERIRQFARVYQPVNALPAPLSAIILN